MNSKWTKFVSEQIGSKTAGMISENNSEIILDWKISGITSPLLAAFKKEVCAAACGSLASTEVEFLKAYPQAVHEELFLKSCEPHFKDNLDTVDWNTVEQSIELEIKQFYSMDLSQFGENALQPLLDDIYFYVTAKERATGKIIGFLMSSITPIHPFGTVKLINLWSPQSALRSSILKQLIDALLLVIPKVDHIYLLCRPTNQEAYLECGFRKYENFKQDPNHFVNLEYFIPLEYK